MRIRLIAVPYHLGHEREGMGMGPVRLLESGAADRLRARGRQVQVEWVRRERDFTNEVAEVLELDCRLSSRVRECVADGEFPLVLAGDCNSCLGTLAGLAPARVGIVWFDAHGDFNTPETTESGNFDGMALATATGRCLKRAVAAVSGLEPVPESRVLLVGVRALDRRERDLLGETGMQVLPAARMRGGAAAGVVERALADIDGEIQGLYVHVDLDVLDPQVAPANPYAAPGGLALEDLKAAIQTAARRFPVLAAALTAYDPAGDPEGTALEAGLKVLELLADLQLLPDR